MKKDKDDFKIKQEDENQPNHMIYGMSFGLLAGSVGMSILAMFGHIAWGGVSVGVGLLLGMVIGLVIPRKK